MSKFAREHGTEEQLEMPEIADGNLSVMCNQLNGLNARVDGLTKLFEQHAWLDAEPPMPVLGNAHIRVSSM